MNKRRKFTSEFKAQVVLEVLSGAKSPAQACREYQIRDSLLCRWKRQFVERAPQVFEQEKAQDPSRSRVAELERMVGRLTMELEISKKASLLLSVPRNGNGSWR